MIVNHRYKYIYIDIPKTGSSSLDDIFRRLGGVNLAPNKKFSKHGRIIPENCKDYIRVASIRNPYTRIYSSYQMMLRRRIDVPKNTFEDYIDHSIKLLEYPDNETEDTIYRLFPTWKYLKPIQPINYIVRMEYMQEDVDKLPFPVRGVDKINTFNYGTFEEIATPEIIKKINLWADDEFKTYGYKKL